MKKESILEFDVCNLNQEELVNNIFEDYEDNKQNFIVNINPEIIINNYKNKEKIRIFNEQRYQIPDGIGIVYASKIKKGNINSRITGIDLMNKLCEESIKHNAKIFLYGAAGNISNLAKEELEKKYNGIQIVGCCNGYEKEEVVIEKIKKSSADILFVGTGSPKQEDFIINHKKELNNIKIFMPVGGSFDVISNTKKRAPKWMIKLNLEWFYRLIQEPKRFFRQLKLLKFMLLIIFKGEKINVKRKNI